MTLEEAAAEIENAAESLNGPDPSQAALRMAAGVLHAFPEILEALREIAAGRLDHEHDPEAFHARAREVAGAAIISARQTVSL